MLWRFSFASTSMVDALLSRETPPSVEELMDEQDILSECKAQNNKLVTYLSKEDSVKTLLQWVVSGLDELDQQAALAESMSFDQAMTSPALFPFSHSQPPPLGVPVPGPGPNSPPLEPAKMAYDNESKDESEEAIGFPGAGLGIGLGEGLERQESRDSDVSRSRYPQIATEILTSELWTIPETVMAHKDTLLRPFWDAVLPVQEVSTPSTVDSSRMSRQEQSERERARDEFWSEKDEERERKREVIRGLWTRVNGALISKRTTEMTRFIQSLPNIVDRLLAQITSPAVQDMLVRIVSTEEAGVTGVVDWLAAEGLIPRLLAFLSPHHSTSMHSIASEILKSIITLCAPSPFNPNGGNASQPGQNPVQPPGNRDNRLIRELVSESSINTMIGSMLDDVEITDRDWRGLNDDPTKPSPSDPFVVHPLPSLASVASSLSHICNILVELIRRNNSDYSEPHLFHTLRQRLMTIQMQNATTGEANEAKEAEARKEMEEAMEEMSAKMGIVHLGNLITAISDRFGQLHRILLEPRSQARAASAQIAAPLTLERFRVVELYAELLHSSNMSILNRPIGTGPTYTADGIISGGLTGLEALGEAIEGDRIGEGEESPEEHVTQARELPVSSGSTDCSMTGSEEVASDDEEMLEHIEDETTPAPSPSASTTLVQPQEAPTPVPPPPSQADVARLRDVMDTSNTTAASDLGSVSHAAVAATTAAPSVISEPIVANAAQSQDELPPGDRLKQMYIQHRVLPAVVDLFFEYPNNDFMHHVVYDLLQQILNGRSEPGLNRELVIELLCEAKLIERILDAQRINDRMIQQPRTPRLAYMGHVVLIAEELVKFFARCPLDLFDVISPSFVQSEWEAFVEGSLRETKARDAQPLAGGKPMAVATAADVFAKSEDSSSDDEEEAAAGDAAKFGEPLTRTNAADGFANRQRFDSFADRDSGSDDEQFWKSGAPARRHVDSSDEEEDDADWLRPSVSTIQGDDDEFGAFQATAQRPTSSDDFDDDDGWGTFTSSTVNDDPDNPFGDDNFAPSVIPAPPMSRPAPLTPHDWASEFDREFADVDLPAIVVPDLNDENDADVEGSPAIAAAASGWTFTGDEGESEDLPPTTSPTLGDVEQVPVGDVKSDDRKPTPIPIQPPPISTSVSHVDKEPSPTSPVTIPRRASASAPHPGDIFAASPPPVPSASSPPQPSLDDQAASLGATGEAYSPPDAALIAATGEEAPLGPGVSPDTHVTKDGMLEKEVDGHMVVVPQDEIVRGVEEDKKS